MERVARFYGFEPNRHGYIRCPFHQERTASLKLYPDAKGWHCFGCGKGGSAIDFVMALLHLSYPQALMRLDSDFHLGLTGARPDPSQQAKAGILRRQRENTAMLERQAVAKAAEDFRYYWECYKYFAPTREEWEAGYVHPLYLEAVRELPPLEHFLDKRLDRRK